MTRNKQEYLDYLRHTIIPDTVESGRIETAQDLKKCERLITAGKTNAKFAHFLKETLIPDFRRSGSSGYVEDFRTCARYITPRR
jgi:hypothetical protein